MSLLLTVLTTLERGFNRPLSHVNWIKAVLSASEVYRDIKLVLKAVVAMKVIASVSYNLVGIVKL